MGTGLFGALMEAEYAALAPTVFIRALPPLHKVGTTSWVPVPDRLWTDRDG